MDSVSQLGKRIFDEYGFSSQTAPEELAWLIGELLHRARKYPEKTDMELLDFVMEDDPEEWPVPKPRYTIEDIRGYAQFRLRILAQVQADNPNLDWPPLDKSAWWTLAHITDAHMRLGMNLEALVARGECSG